jgi:glycosyltransferase involved in cell wall biosynthesis
MALAKPVLVSDAEPLKRIVLETNSGYVFESGNAESAAKSIEKAFISKKDRELLGQNGLRAIRDKFNWSVSEKELIKIYRK